MPKRLTIPVEDIKFWVNNILAHDEREITAMVGDLTPQQAYRLATAAILEAALHKTGNYKGYNYLGLPADPQEFPQWEKDGDKTRRRYY